MLDAVVCICNPSTAPVSGRQRKENHLESYRPASLEFEMQQQNVRSPAFLQWNVRSDSQTMTFPFMTVCTPTHCVHIHTMNKQKEWEKGVQLFNGVFENKIVIWAANSIRSNYTHVYTHKIMTACICTFMRVYKRHRVVDIAIGQCP